MVTIKKIALISYILAIVIIDLCCLLETSPYSHKGEYYYVAQKSNPSIETNPHIHKGEYYPVAQSGNLGVYGMVATTWATVATISA
jgi:hypothetical protein